MNKIDEINLLENKYRENNYFGFKEIQSNIVSFGSFPILISCPHSIRQRRDGKDKTFEFFTGAIGESISKDLGCYFISKDSFNKNLENDDANFESIETCKYKQFVYNFLKENEIKLFIDIHGLSHKKESIIDICTFDGKNINNLDYDITLKRIVDEEFGEGAASINRYYKAEPINTMSRFVNTSFNIPSIEIEINGKYRWFQDDCAKDSLRLYNCFLNWILKEI